MKTIVIKGSPNTDGYTNKLLKEALVNLEGEIIEYDAYKLNVNPCTDCKYCDHQLCKCSIDDDMTGIYHEMIDADNIVIASPIHVASVTAPLLAILSRFQVYFACKFKHQKDIPLKKKKGFLVVTAGSDWPRHFENVKTIVETSFLELNATLEATVYQSFTDQNAKVNNIEEFRRKLRGDNMKIFDNYQSELREFKPIKDNEVTMYVCGPTVYNYIHIGNARPVVFFDVVRRYMEYLGYKVRLISNLTDVDDKIINRAIDEGVDEKEISEKYTKAFIKAGDMLNVKRASNYPKATDYINEMASFIEGLIEKDYAYLVDGDVYFRVSKIEEYGKLSNQAVDDLEVGARIEENSKKENPLDFTLWKATDVGVNYPTKFSEGRPGWHTECVVMIDALTGGKIDIHAGGSGLKFPHHENEIAQSLAMHDHSIANYWMHVGMININNKKMSKSEGEVKWVKDLVLEYDPNVLRLAIISTHYRQPINFNDDLLADCVKTNDKIINAYKQGKVYSELNSLENGNALLGEFEDAMNNDFNTANAITSLLSQVKVLNQVTRQKDNAAIADSIASVETMAEVLGLELPKIKFNNEDRSTYHNWVAARKEKDFESADKYRALLEERGLL